MAIKIHYVKNGKCDICGKTEDFFLPYAADIHTHGLKDSGSPELQIVVAIPPELAQVILMELAEKIAGGESMAGKKEAWGILRDSETGEDVPVHLAQIGEYIRVILPDPNMMYADTDKDVSYPYSLQTLPTQQLAARTGEKM